MNWWGLFAVGCALAAFAVAWRELKRQPRRVRLVALATLSLLALPSILFTVYYLHILPEWAWFYTLRSWRGSEFLVVFLGAAAGAYASLWPRWLLGVPYVVVLAVGFAPYLKPLLAPLPEDAITERWQEDVCLQSTASTCGPASVASILRHFGLGASERIIARAAYSYAGGTEAWYLARYLRQRGLKATFDFSKDFALEARWPVLVGVQFGGAGHFLSVLEIRDGQVTYAEPLEGKKEMALADFQRRYRFTDFHLVVTKPAELR